MLPSSTSQTSLTKPDVTKKHFPHSLSLCRPKPQHAVIGSIIPYLVPLSAVDINITGTLSFNFNRFLPQGFQPPVLIFVQSKERAKELFHELIYDGFNVDVIHADKSQEQVWSLKKVPVCAQGTLKELREGGTHGGGELKKCTQLCCLIQVNIKKKMAILTTGEFRFHY